MVTTVLNALLGGTTSQQLEAIVAAHDTAAKNYGHYRDYWNGKHPVRLTERLKQFLQGTGFHAGEGMFRDNVCPLVIESLADRLRIAAFTVPGEDIPPAPEGETGIVPGDPAVGKVGPIAQFAAETWARNRGDKLQMRVHENAVGVGDAFVFVEWDPEEQRVRFTYNAAELVRVYYDAENAERVRMASKRWTVSNEEFAAPGAKVEASVRLNVYYPERIERWIRNGVIGGGTWREFTDDAFPEWPIWWTDTGTAEGAPLGVPVVQFANNDRGENTGRSEIADVIPLQDALNKAVVDAVRTMDAQGWPQRWATGISEAPTDDLISTPGALWHTKDAGASFGQMDEITGEGIIALWNKFEESVAAVTRTPQHLFRVTGGVPSGEALKTAENGLVSKAIKRGIVFGDSWEDVMALAMRIARANGVALGELPASGFSVEWENPETRGDELQHIQSINAKEGISRRQRWREYGYTDEQIQRMEEELAEEPDVLEEAMAAFDAGAGASAEMRGRPTGGARR